MIALPKTAQTQALLAPFTEARGYDDQGVEVEDYGKRLVVVIYCAFEGTAWSSPATTRTPWKRL